MADGRLYLEDPFASVPLEAASLETALTGRGYITQGSYILCDGELIDGGLLRVHGARLPPCEPPSTSLSYFGHVDFLGTSKEGGGKNPLVDADLYSTIAAAEEAEGGDAMIVVLSDVHLDNPLVMQRLEMLFEGFKDIAPTAFVFLGSFSSKPLTPDGRDLREYRRGFASLADLIHGYPTLREESRFVFVPGPNDMAGPDVLPRPPIPDTIVQPMLDRVRNAIFTSNPCRSVLPLMCL